MKYVNVDCVKEKISGVFSEYIPEILDEMSGEDVISVDWLIDVMLNGEPDDSKAAWRIKRLWEKKEKTYK